MTVKPVINDVILFDVFGKDFDRFDFPAEVHRVTSGSGGESYLIIGSEKTALYDCGMAYCGIYTVANIRNALNECGRNTLDIIILSHSHYDHIGALSYILEEYPKAIVYGSEKSYNILQKPNAKKLMKELGTSARELFMPGSCEEIRTDNLHVDIVLKDGDEISLGDEKIVVLETKGHTDCSLTYVLEPVKLMFASESTGMLEGREYVHTPFLKDYNDAIASMNKCQKYKAKYLCLPHFGMIPETFNDTYWNMLHNACEEKYMFIKGMKDSGLCEADMLEEYVKKYWQAEIEEIQPKDAFLINSNAIIKAFLKTV